MGKTLILLLVSVSLQAQYCVDSASSIGDYSDITQVSIYRVMPTSLIHVFTNISSCGTTGNPTTSYMGRYSDYTNQNIFLLRGVNYVFKLTRKSCPNTMTYPSSWDHFYFGIDSMNTGIISLNHLGFGSLIADTHEYIIQMPLSTTTTTTRMRIRFNNICNGGAVNTCSSYIDGETEDYTVHFCKPLTYNLTSEQPKCYGDSNGRGNVVINGGLAPVKIKWDNGPLQLKDSIVTLKAGRHYMTILDSGMCEYRDSFDIENPFKLQANVVVDSTCQSDSVGRITVNASGGVGDLLYSFDNQPYSSVFIKEDLPFGSHNIKIKDENNCILDSNAFIYSKNFSLINYSFAVDSIDCFNKNNGKVSINASNGTPPFLYSYNNSSSSQSSPVFNNLAKGNYTFKINDSKGCYKKFTSTLFAPDTLKPVLKSLQSLTCLNATDGSLNISAIGGKFNRNYTYLWNTGGTDTVLSGLTSGNYVVTVTDSFGCKNNATYLVKYPLDTLKLRFTFIDKNTCPNDSNSIIIIKATGGKTPYLYSIDGLNYFTTDTFKKIKSTYINCFVKDANNCIVRVDSLLTYKYVPISYLVNKATSLCYDVKTSSVYFSITGGFAPYLISMNGINWSPPSVLNNIVTNKMYYFQIKDQSNCIYSDSFILPTSVKPVNTYDIVHNNCLRDTIGKISILNTVNGVAPLQYSINNSPYSNISVFDRLISKQYIIRTKDANLCEILDTFNIKDSSLFSYKISKKDISCFGQKNGEINMISSQSNSAIQYSCNGPYNSNNSYLFLAKSNYNVSIKYDNSCKFDTIISINEPAILKLNTNINLLKCSHDSNASIECIPSGGTTPYFYSFDKATYSTINKIGNLKSGNYNIKIKDTNGCIDSTLVSISNPDDLKLKKIDLKDISCFGKTDGHIEVTMEGGTTPYSYSWSPYGLNTPRITSLTKGNYFLKIIDSNNCFKKYNFEIKEPEKLNAKIAILQENKCFNDSIGIVEAEATGGILPYTYYWNVGRIKRIEKLPPSTYLSLKIIDSNQCEDTTSVTLTSINKIETLYQVKSPECPKVYNGSINIFAKGGAPFNHIYKYLYSIDGIKYQTSSNFSFLAPKSYTFLIKDSNNCVEKINISIASPNTVDLFLDSILRIETLGDKILLNPIVTNQNLITKYQWTPTDGLSCIDCIHPEVSIYSPQKYQLAITYNEHKCFDTATVLITVPMSNSTDLFIPTAFSPERYNDVKNSIFKVYGHDILAIEMAIYNRWGEEVFIANGTKDVFWDGKYKGEFAPLGVYIYNITIRFLDQKVVERKGSVSLLR